MNVFHAAALTAALLAMPGSALAEKAQNEGFVVSGNPEVRTWTDSVGKKLDNQLAYQQRVARPTDSHTGIVPPLPAAHALSNEILVNIVLAKDEKHMGQLRSKLAGWEAERLARSPAERRVLAFNSMSR